MAALPALGKSIRRPGGADPAADELRQVVLVFDAWMSDRMQRTTEVLGPVTVVYTRKNETADHYIERLCDSYSREMEYGRLEIRVATSDNVEQTVVLGRGAIRLSSRELLYPPAGSRGCGKTPAQDHAHGPAAPGGAGKAGPDAPGQRLMILTEDRLWLWNIASRK